MTNETIIISVINIIIFVVLWFYFIREYFVDSTRHELFVLRDQLFEYALKNNIPFDNPAFKLRWEEMNALIRLTHESHLIFLSSILFARKKKKEIIKFVKERNEILESLAPKHREYFERNKAQELSLFFSYIIKSSLILLIITVIGVFLLSFIMFAFWLLERVNLYPRIKDKVLDTYNDYQYVAMNTTG